METTQTNELDVTLLDPRMKHPTIFKRFDSLPEGEALIIRNDHDPKPLYYQMINERGPVFHWEYLEDGPVWWKVKITKQNRHDDRDETVGEILSTDIRKAGVFKKYGIDFCCGGKKKLSEVCVEKGLDQPQIEKELSQVSTHQSTRSHAYNKWEADFLADYIINTHHTFVKETLPELQNYAAKVASVHGANHPELIAIRQNIEALSEELFSHLAKEENILFPYIHALVAAKKGTKPADHSPFGTVNNPIHMMEAEHDAAGKLITDIRALTNNFTLPEDACTSFALLYKLLEEFESDLHTHIHLENNILFPKAVELEKEIGD